MTLGDIYAFLDLRAGRVISTVPLTDEGTWLTPAGKYDWLVTASGTLLRLDAVGHEPARTVSLGFAPANQGLIAADGALWAAAADRPLLLRLDPEYGTVQRSYRLPTDGAAHRVRLDGMTFAAGSLWIGQGKDRVLRIDPVSGRVIATIPTPGVVAIAGTDDTVWVSGGDESVVYQVDPMTNTVTAQVRLDGFVCCVAAGAGSGWAMTQRVFRLMPSGHVATSVPIEGDGANLHWSDGALWVSEGVSGRFTRVDPTNDSTSVITTGGLALQAISRGDIATVVVGAAPRDLLAGIPPPIARVAVDTDRLKPDDPALRAEHIEDVPWRAAVLDATCAHLVRPADAGNLWSVEPEIADRPSTTDQRTWTFTIKPGWRFSPPSNAPVTAEAMRQTIQRAMSPRMGSSAPGRRLLNDLDRLEVRGESLIVTLRKPASDLPLRLADDVFCAVPAGTPANATTFSDQSPPTAGPYYLAKHFAGLYAVLARNPGYGGTRPQLFGGYLVNLWANPSSSMPHGISDHRNTPTRRYLSPLTRTDHLMPANRLSGAATLK